MSTDVKLHITNIQCESDNNSAIRSLPKIVCRYLALQKLTLNRKYNCYICLGLFNGNKAYIYTQFTCKK